MLICVDADFLNTEKRISVFKNTLLRVDGGLDYLVHVIELCKTKYFKMFLWLVSENLPKLTVQNWFLKMSHFSLTNNFFSPFHLNLLLF